MPIYEYELCEGSCRLCKGRFEIKRPMGWPALTNCPLCRKPVRKCISAVNTLKKSGGAFLAKAKESGFTVLQKKDSGTYEKQ